jgi:CheY-like chemotaxis protein
MPELAGVILIAMSGYGSKEHRAQARQAGFDAYMVKPIDLDRLQEMLSERR